MSNPYYFPQQNSWADSLQNSIQLGMQMYGLRQKARSDELDRSIKAKQLAEHVRQGELDYGTGTPGTASFVPGLKQRALDLTEKNINTDIERNQIAAEKNRIDTLPHNQIMKTTDIMAIEEPLVRVVDGKRDERMKNNFKPVIDSLKSLTGKVTNVEAVKIVGQQWSFHKPQITENLINDRNKRIAENPNFAGSVEDGQLKQVIDLISMSDDQGNTKIPGPNGQELTANLVPYLFPKFITTMESYVAEQSAKKALLAKTTTEAMPTMDKVAAQKVLEGKPEEAVRLIHPTAESKAPTVHSFTEGRNIVNKQWDPAKKEWVEVSRGEKDKPFSIQEPKTVVTTGPNGEVLIVDKNARTASPVKMQGEGGEKVYKMAPSEVKTSHVALKDNLASLSEVKKAYNKGLIGPVTGATKKIGSKFFADKDFTTLRNRVGQLRTIVYGLSGKAINETEDKWLKEEIIPNLMQPSENFEVTMNEFEAWVVRKKGFLEGAYPGLESGKKQTSGGSDPLGLR